MVTNVAWFLWSQPKLDKDHLKNELFEWSKIEFGIRWMPIPGSQPSPDGSRVKALVISAALNQAVEAERFVYKAWDADDAFFPANLRLRPVPMLKDVTTREGIQEHEILTNLQGNFAKAIMTRRNQLCIEEQGPLGLHRKIQNHKVSPYEFLMRLQSSSVQGRRLFISIGTHMEQSNSDVCFF